MFFLGISAHLMFYLLVPALLIVCCYFKGLSGNPEVMDPLPANQEYEFSSHAVFAGSYYFYDVQKEELKPENTNHFRLTSLRTGITWPVYQQLLHPVLFYASFTLRAPPSRW